MTHSLTLEIPEKIYRTLAQKASKNGKEIEEVAVERLSVEWPEDIVDPLDKYIGAFSSGIGDVGLNHDKYIGENLLREMRGEKE
jgi:hypothetical protein